jgi:type IV secretory pathway TrbD component
MHKELSLSLSLMQGIARLGCVANGLLVPAIYNVRGLFAATMFGALLSVVSLVLVIIQIKLDANGSKGIVAPKNPKRILSCA